MSNAKITTIKLHIPSLFMALIATISFIAINFYSGIDTKDINIFASNSHKVRVKEVVNENTLKLEDDSEIRIIGIEAFTENSSQKQDLISVLETNLKGKSIYLQDGTEPNNSYKHVWLSNNFDDTTKNIQKNNIAGLLLSKGLCKYSGQYNKYDKNFTIIYILAKSNKKGIWE